MRRDASARLGLAVPLLIAIAAAAAAAADEAPTLDDVLGGFEEEVPEEFQLEPEDAEPEREPTIWDRFDLTGSVSLAATWNFLDHKSPGLVPGPLSPQPPGTGTIRPKQWEGLSRLRTKLNLQLDVDLPEGWKTRISGFAWYDFAFRIDDRSDFSHHALNDYESWWDLSELWVQGSPIRRLDVKIGRQIVNWGRSDNLRVVDVINPLDNREPGLMDIEDLRRPVGMARIDYYLGDWSVSALVIPELRFDRNPPFGSDFNPFPFALPTDEPDHWGGTPEFAGSVNGIFEGWDISFYGGYFMDNEPVLERVGFAPPPAMGFPPTPLFAFGHSRFGMAGAGANYTWGGWLFKAEIAFFDDRKVSIPAGFGAIGVRRDNLDAMGGIEYYGITDTSIAVEFANRRILNYTDSLEGLVEKNAVETAIRVTSDFLNQKLQVTALALLFGETVQDGSVVRLQADYDLRDGLELTGGMNLFQDGDSVFFDQVRRNDRLFAQLKYSF